MKKNWKNEREELINFLYKQNAQIMDDRENLLGDMFACQANKELYIYFLQEIEHNIANLAEQAQVFKKAIEEADEELLAYKEKAQALDDEIKSCKDQDSAKDYIKHNFPSLLMRTVLMAKSIF